MNPQFKTIFATVRPQKVAVLIDVNDPYWESTCLEVIQYFSRVWGGNHNIIVPTDGKVIDANFWSILKAFQPDHIYSYYYLFQDLKRSDPVRYDELLQQDVRQWVSQNPEWTIESATVELDRSLSGGEWRDFALSAELTKKLRDTLAPFHFENRVTNSVGANNQPRFPLTSISEILPNSKLQQKRVAILNSQTQLLSPLWLAAAFGSANHELLNELQSVGIERVTIDIHEQSVSSYMSLAIDSPFIEGGFPFSLCATGLSTYRDRGYREDEEPAVAVFGNTVSDFCVYYGLSRLRDRVMWVPPNLLGEAPEYVMQVTNVAMTLANSQRYSNREIVFLSNSQTQDLANIKAGVGIGSLVGKINLTYPFQQLLRSPKLLFEAGNAGRTSVGQFIDDELAGFLDTPKPINFSYLSPTKHRWVTEIDIEGYRPLQHHLIGQYLLSMMGGVGTLTSRVASTGICYGCPTTGTYFGGTTDEVLIRPKLRLLSAESTMKILCEASALRMQTSDKGFYTGDAIRIFGSLEKLATVFRNPGYWAVLEKFLDSRRPTAGVYDDGAYVQGRRYLNFEAIRKLSKDEQSATGLIDEMCQISAFLRGFIFQCRFCRNSDWYSVSELSETFRCKRCSRNQVYVTTNWKYPKEPSWYYKLDEIVFLAIKNGCVTSVLANDTLRKRSPKSFLYTLDSEFYELGSDRPFMEVDIVCISEGKLFIGEAKKEDFLADTSTKETAVISRYVDLAKRLGAHGLVFATLSPQWSESTNALIRRIAPTTDLELIQLARADLLGEPEAVGPQIG